MKLEVIPFQNWKITFASVTEFELPAIMIFRQPSSPLSDFFELHVYDSLVLNLCSIHSETGRLHDNELNWPTMEVILSPIWTDSFRVG